MKLIEVLKKFFNKLKLNKTKMINEKSENSPFYDDKRDEFVSSLYNNDVVRLNELQIKLDNNEISVNDINIFDVMELIDKYQGQINEMLT